MPLVQQDHPDTYRRILQSLLALEAASSEAFDQLQGRIAQEAGEASSLDLMSAESQIAVRPQCLLTAIRKSFETGSLLGATHW